MTKAQLNRKQYLVAPTWEQIDAFRLKCRVKSMARFEQFFGLAAKTLWEVKNGKRDFPAKFWHIIYEAKEPEPPKLKYSGKISGKARQTNSLLTEPMGSENISTPSMSLELLEKLNKLKR